MPVNMVSFGAGVKLGGELDCQRCGACCFAELPTYVRVSGDDHARLAERAEALTEFHGNRCYLRMLDGHCAALAIDRVEGRFACDAYAQRPETCRALEPGSPACEAERIHKAARAAAALRSGGGTSEEP